MTAPRLILHDDTGITDRSQADPALTDADCLRLVISAETLAKSAQMVDLLSPYWIRLNSFGHKL